MSQYHAGARGSNLFFVRLNKTQSIFPVYASETTLKICLLQVLTNAALPVKISLASTPHNLDASCFG